MATKGLIMVHTGYGKGKTTAALGLAFRSLGHGLPVCVIQFIKGTWKVGELHAAERFADLLEFHVAGEGFTWNIKDPEDHRRAARDGWELARGKIEAGRHHLVILDEFTYAMNLGMLDEREVLACLRQKPEATHVLITGRDAPTSLIDIADLVTEMRDIKHPLKAGVKAQRGIEF